jgi:hypothetical protein
MTADTIVLRIERWNEQTRQFVSIEKRVTFDELLVIRHPSQRVWDRLLTMRAELDTKQRHDRRD